MYIYIYHETPTLIPQPTHPPLPRSGTSPPRSNPCTRSTRP